MGNFSKQREEIKQAVLKSEQHLTAEEIYNIVKQKIIESGILSHDKVLMNLSFCGINGNGIIRHKFFKEAKELMK